MEVADGEGQREEGSTGGRGVRCPRPGDGPESQQESGRRSGAGEIECGGAGRVSAGESEWRQRAERGEVKCEYRAVCGTVRPATPDTRSIALIVDKGIIYMEAYTGMLLRLELMRTSLPPRLKVLPCHPSNLLNIFSSMGVQSATWSLEPETGTQDTL